MGYELFRAFGEALALGFLIGSERYRGRSSGDQETAGVRTFTIIALLGATSALLENTALTLVIFSALVIFLALGYYRGAADDFGLTTEMAALLTFWLGYLVLDFETLAISSGIVVVILLASKKALHDFVREQVSEVEFFDTLKFLAVVFVVFPLLPDEYIGPFQFLNPTKIWLLIVLISSISYVGYVLIRLLGDRKGLAVSAILGGIVSTTAVTVSLAERARKAAESSRLFGFAGVLANSVQPPRLLLLIAVVDIGLAQFLALPFLAMAVVGMLGAWRLSDHLQAEESFQLDTLLQNPYSLRPVLECGVLFVAIFFLIKVAGIWMGNQGIFLISAVAGMGSVSAVSLSVADAVHRGDLGNWQAAIAILIAMAANAFVKWVISWFRGTRQLAYWLGGGLLVMLLTGGVLIVVGRWWAMG